MTSVSNYFHLFLFLNKNSPFFFFFWELLYTNIFRLERNNWSIAAGPRRVGVEHSTRPGPAGRAPLLIDNRRPLLEFVAVELFVSLHTHFIYSSVDCYEILVVVVELRKQKFDSN